VQRRKKTVAVSIGSGPAGLAAAQQLTERDIRYRFERDNAIGGLLRNRILS
jgi:NADPH-dependent glutamate synthase beta subunit-like oxidoreductase